MPELTIQVQEALDAAETPGATARVYAFGEDCFDPQSGDVIRFATMETDFDIELEVADLQDLDTLGDLTDRVLAVLDTFPPGSVPGPQPGRVGLLFTSGDEQKWVYFMVEQAEVARSRGLGGRALLEALGYQP